MRKCSLAAIAAVSLSVGLLSAQAATVTWTGLGANDNWNINANWSGTGQPPNFMDDAVVGPPAPTVLNVNGLVMTLKVDDGGVINMLGGNDLTITQGVLTNFGQIVVNSDVVDLLSRINLGTTTTIDGKGTITLNKQFFQGTPPFTQTRGATIESSNTVTHGASHTIEGHGQINATLINEGTVRADSPFTSPTITLVLGPSHQQFNENLFASSPGAALVIRSPRVTQGTNGYVLADTRFVTLDGVRIVGGSLQSMSGGEFSVSANGARLEDIHNQATVNAGNSLIIEGAGFVNDGLVRGGSIRFDTAMTISGNGSFYLNNGNIFTLGALTLTQAANHSIRGRGTINAELINNGLIEPDPPSGVPTPTITLSGANKTNNNLINVPVGTTLQVNQLTLTQDPNNGRITSAGQVRLATGSKVTGGRIETSGAGFVDINGMVTLTDVTLDATAFTRSATLRVQGSSLTNDGTLTVNQHFANLVHTVLFEGQNAMSLAGAGEIILNGPTSRAEITVASGKTLNHEYGHKITGFGWINGNFANEGDIIGDSEFNPIQINGPLSGAGRLENVRINGVHAVGSASFYHVPAFGMYELTSSANVQFEIGGTHVNYFDTIYGHDFKLNGTLSISQVDAGLGFFQPQLGDTFEIINGLDITGTFNSVQITGLDPKFDYKVHYSTTSVTLEAIRRYSADFDFDGDVDNDDLVKWEMGYGMSGGASYMDGDADEDGDVDGRDFLTWQRQYGSGLGPLVASTAVPEPAAGILLMMGWGIATTRLRLGSR